MKPGGEYKEMGKAGAIALKTVVVLLMVVMLTACARVDDFMSAKYNIQIGNYIDDHRQSGYDEPSQQTQDMVEPTATPRPTPEPTPEPTATPRPTPEPTATPLRITKEAAEHYDIGRKRFNSENYEAAVPHLKIAAEGGHPGGWRMYGWCLLYGKGTKKNAREGYKYMKMAAETGDALAQYEMGYCNYAALGTVGDYEAAVEWYRLAAEQGQKNALLNLGYCYQMGYGVDKDYEMAKKYYELALEAGNSKAKKRLREVEALMGG